MHPQRRTALVSVLAAAALIALKLTTGLLTHSLGLISEAAHSGTDLVAALLTFAAVGVAIRPADRGHPYGHGKAEHLGALAEGGLLVVVSLVIVYRAISHVVGDVPTRVDPAWYAFAVIAVVIAVDLSRATISARASRRYGSAALQANALHFAGDLLGSVSVLIGLAVARAGYPQADSFAALVVAILVVSAAGRLMRRNIDVLMDRAPADAEAAARKAIEQVSPEVDLRRLRIRQAAGRHFADVVIGVSAGGSVGQGHAAADLVEAAVQRALPATDVVVHVEPVETEALMRERAHAAAMRVPRVREVHDVAVVNVDGRTEISMHLKLPGDMTLDEAHEVATGVEGAILAALPEVDSVQTHLEPLTEEAEGRSPERTTVERDREAISRVVLGETGLPPRELRFVETDEGLVAFLTLGLEAESTLAEAHERARLIEEGIRRVCPHVVEVTVHTEP